MAVPQACIIGQKDEVTIWSVDDIWFEGILSLGSPDPINMFTEFGFRLLPDGTETNFRLLSDETKVSFKTYKIGDEYCFQWKYFLEKIQSREGKISELQWDFEYLKLLSGLSYPHQIRLILCNFEYFETAFKEANQKNNAILLDINYNLSPSRDKSHYGIEMIRRLLAGHRPRADIFFVTAYPELQKKVIEQHQDDPTWWIMRSLPIVEKGKDTDIDSVATSKLERELQCFFAYFTQGIIKSWRDIIQEFCDTLIRVYAEKIETHPRTLSDIPEDFFLRESFDKSDNVHWNELHTQSFIALYNYDVLSKKSKGDRPILVKVLKHHLAHANITLNLGVDVTDYDYIKLPVQPGMLFLINFMDFLYKLNENESDNHQIFLDIDNTSKEGKIRAILKISLDKDKAGILKEGVTTDKGGETINCFRDLIACKEFILFKYMSDTFKDEAENLGQVYKKNKIFPENRREIYHQLIDFKFDTDKSFLILYWDYDPLPKRIANQGYKNAATSF